MARKKKHDSIWDDCCVALAAAERKAQEAARLDSAARELSGFTPTESGRWMQYCPHCGGKLSCTATTAALAWLLWQ